MLTRSWHATWPHHPDGSHPGHTYTVLKFAPSTRPACKALFLVALTVASCSTPVIPAATPTSSTIRLQVWATTSTVTLLQDATQEYGLTRPNLVVETKVGNHATLASQTMQEQSAYFISNHLEPNDSLWAAPIGQDGIAIILHPQNPVTDLTIEQLRGIYLGQISNWRELGGEEQPIQVISREAGSGTRLEFQRLVMGDRMTTQAAVVVPTHVAMQANVAANPNYIGYISAGALGDDVNTVAVNGVLPTMEAIQTNAYPLRSTLFMIGVNEPAGETRAFIGWIQSQPGQAVVARRYAPLLP